MYLERTELPDIRLYDLRNTFATLWLESGEHPKILQEILGNSRISITLATYSQVAPHMQREAMGRFGRMFSKSSGASLWYQLWYEARRTPEKRKGRSGFSLQMEEKRERARRDSNLRPSDS